MADAREEDHEGAQGQVLQGDPQDGEEDLQGWCGGLRCPVCGVHCGDGWRSSSPWLAQDQARHPQALKRIVFEKDNCTHHGLRPEDQT